MFPIGSGTILATLCFLLVEDARSRMYCNCKKCSDNIYIAIMKFALFVQSASPVLAPPFVPF